MFTPSRATAPRSRPSHLAAQRIRAYWEGLRTPGRLPLVHALDPRGFAPYLEHVFLAECAFEPNPSTLPEGLTDARADIATAHAPPRLRLAGRGISQMAGRDMHRGDLFDLFTPEAAHLLRPGLRRVFAGLQILTVDLEAKGYAHPEIAPHGVIATARLLLLPLQSGQPHKACLLGCLIPGQPIPLSPTRFHIARITEDDVSGLALRPRGQLIHIRNRPSAATFPRETSFDLRALAEDPASSFRPKEPARIEAPPTITAPSAELTATPPDAASPESPPKTRWSWLRRVMS